MACSTFPTTEYPPIPTEAQTEEQAKRCRVVWRSLDLRGEKQARSTPKPDEQDAEPEGPKALIEVDPPQCSRCYWGGPLLIDYKSPVLR